MTDLDEWGIAVVLVLLLSLATIVDELRQSEKRIIKQIKDQNNKP
jgi:hypothetical protein